MSEIDRIVRHGEFRERQPHAARRAARRGAVRTFWARTIEDRRGRTAAPPTATPGAAPPKSQPPQAVEGLGERALWSGDSRTGSISVLAHGSILRVSAGGAGTEEEERDRSVSLARRALERLAATGASATAK